MTWIADWPDWMGYDQPGSARAEWSARVRTPTRLTGLWRAPAGWVSAVSTRHLMATVKGGDKVVVHQRLGDPAALGPGLGQVIDISPEPPGQRRPLTPPTEQPTVLSTGQRVGLIALGVALVAGLVVAPVATMVAVMAVLVVFFMAANVMKLALISKALNDPHRVAVDVTGERVADDQLPVYTILLPVYHEASMLTQLVEGVLSLDYPEDRLDVKLLLEEDDNRDAGGGGGHGPPGLLRRPGHPRRRAERQAPGVQPRPGPGPGGVPGHLRRRGPSRGRPAPQVGDGLRRGRARRGLPAGPAQLLQPHLQPAHPVVHRRVLGLVRPAAPRAAGHGRGHPPRRHLQPLRHLPAARRSAGGTAST